jgi:P4 family phage/plasmid primase-like protien|nr:MAG TPA: dsDNA helicase [Caudoviricetes sp.]
MYFHLENRKYNDLSLIIIENTLFLCDKQCEERVKTIEMDKIKYKKLLTEVFGLMDEQDLSSALSLSKSAMRVDAVQDLLRNAIIRSSISMFNGLPHYFSGKVYEPMSPDDFGSLIYDLMRKCALPNGDYSRVEGVIKVCKRVVSGKALRPDSAIVVFNNCVLNMNDRTTHKFGRQWVQVTSVPYDYNPDEHIFLWKQFIDEVLPDEGWQHVFQEFLGSIFIDRRTAKIETMLVLRGSGSNGKSVVFETIMGILGRDNVSNFGIGALITGTERKKNIAYINGKRLNYCSEIQALEIGRDSDVLKSLISGEPTEARPMYGDNFTAYDIPLLMANANQMPYLKDWSYGMKRRICILPFEIEIPIARQRKSLARDLEREYSAIFNWILEGRDRFIANGYKLSENKKLDKVMDEYQAESSTVMKFMFQMNYLRTYEDVSDVEPKWMPSTILYKRYRKWCKENSITEENVTRFGRILSEAGYRKKRTPDGQVYGLYGKALTEKFRYEREAEQSKKLKQDYSKPIYMDGKRYAYTFEGLGSCLGVGYRAVAAWMRQELLEGCYTKNGRRAEFDLDLVEARLHELKIFGKEK